MRWQASCSLDPKQLCIELIREKPSQIEKKTHDVGPKSQHNAFTAKFKTSAQIFASISNTILPLSSESIL